MAENAGEKLATLHQEISDQRDCSNQFHSTAADFDRSPVDVPNFEAALLKRSLCEDFWTENHTEPLDDEKEHTSVMQEQIDKIVTHTNQEIPNTNPQEVASLVTENLDEIISYLQAFLG